MNRGYQYDFSDNGDKMFLVDERQKKAQTMVKVIKDYFQSDLFQLNLLNVGGSTGIIDEYLSRYFGEVIGVDIDEKAIKFASENFHKDNLKFELGDAMKMNYKSNSFDVVICSQVYEHVPDAKIMMKEIYRVLSPGGIVYFAAGNRLMWNEPHYNLPLLSVIPRPLAHLYIRVFRKEKYYYEKHFTYWGLKKLVSDFEVIDYTKKIISSPQDYSVEYMIKPMSRKHKVAKFISKYFYWLVPGYIWLLQKPKA
jgi:ubiquinone/menaquinone biosynthesis C-methylase UbiE